jgi:predicted flap endonuclease-1-like 5' DNA nuclease
MILHFLEVWLLLLVAFAVGGGLGAALYGLVDRSSLAELQGTFADSVGDFIDGVKSKFGLGPDWRDGVRPPVERSSRWSERMAERAAEVSASHVEPPPLLRPSPQPALEAPPVEPEWIEEEAWEIVEEVGVLVEAPGALPPPAAAEPEPAGDPLPAAETGEDRVAKRPAGLAGPRNGVPDNLQKIRGIGKRNEELLNGLGIFHFGQIAAWTPAEVSWVANYLAFPDRIERDDWVGQAIVLASGGGTGFTKSAARRRERRQAAREQAPERPPEKAPGTPSEPPSEPPAEPSSEPPPESTA